MNLKQLLQRLWLNREWQETDTFNLYIDHPFCAQACSFCMLRSSLRTRDNRDRFQTYYMALLNEIDDWAAVLRSHPINTVYFGGGTPSLMSEQLMYQIFDAIPEFLAIRSKCFECDPLSLTSKKLEILAAYGFSYVTFGIQTFDREELHRQHRTNPSVDQLRTLTHYALQLGIQVSYDIMAFLNDDDETDLRRLAEDLRLVMGELRPTAVDIYPMVPKLEGDEAKAIPRIMALRKTLSEMRRSFPEYWMGSEEYLLSGERESLEDRYRNYFLVRMEPNAYFKMIKAYSCSDVAFAPASQNTLALGGYGTREVYSYLDKKLISYRSRFDDDANAFIYY
jgi:MoaA/NifB/PqqE/SkfB family radical SAM enzyme